MNEDFYRPDQDTDTSHSGNSRMAAAAMILAVTSVIFCLIFYISVPLGSLAIILALLSRGRGSLAGRARTAMITGCCGVAVSIGFTGVSAYILLTNPTYRAQLQQMIDYYSSEDAGSLADYLLNEDEQNPQQDGSDDPARTDENENSHADNGGTADNNTDDGGTGNGNSNDGGSQNRNHGGVSGGDLI